MKARLTAAACAAVLFAAPAVVRADSFSPISIGAHAGTLGYGISLERPLLFNLSARIETGAMTVSQKSAFGGQSFEQVDHYNNVLAALDWRPASSRFRISGGLLFGSDHVDYVANNSFGTYLINGHTYPAAAAGGVAARVSFDHPSIYLGAGTGGGIAPGMSISANVGIVILNGSTVIAASGPAAATPMLQSDLAVLRGQFATHVVRPAISIGLLYRP